MRSSSRWRSGGLRRTGKTLMICLDTNFLIDLVREQKRNRPGPAGAKLRRLTVAGETLTTTRINLAELWVGVVRAVDPRSERTAVRDAVADFGVLEVGSDAALVFGKVKAHLLAPGRFPGDFDTLIAAICLVNGHRLVTNNPRHFADVPGLDVEGY